MGETANCDDISDEHRSCRDAQRAGGDPSTFGVFVSSDSQGEPNFDELTGHIKNNIFLLILHLSGRPDRSIAGIELDHPDKFRSKLNLIDAVCQSTWPGARGPSPCDRAAILFKVYDKLSQVAAPVTAMTVAYTLLVAPRDKEQKSASPSGKFLIRSLCRRQTTQPATDSSASSTPPNCGYPHELAKRAYPHLIKSAQRCRTWIDQLPAVMLAVLIGTSLLSWYVGYGKFILLRIEQLDAQRTEIARALDSGKQSQTATTSSQKPTTGASTEAWTQDETHLAQRCPKDGNDKFQVEVESACMAVEQLKKKRLAADEALTEWTSYASWLPSTAAWFAGVVGGPVAKAVNDSETVPEREEQWAANLLSILGNYVLPMMYGFLGAAAAAIMNLKQKIRSCRLSPRDRRMNHVQLVLGVMTGACIGLFLTASGAGSSGTPLSGTSVPLSASALSFLAGFGVEGVFKMLENIMITVFGGKANESASQPHH